MTDQNMPDPNSFLMGGSVPSASFKVIGASITGTISEQPQIQQQRDFISGEPKVWDDGNPMLQLVVTLQTDERDNQIDDDDGRRRVYVKGQMRTAVSEAVRKAGSQGLEVGGQLTVTYTGDGVPSKSGMNPPKLYEAQYVPPANNFLHSTEVSDEEIQHVVDGPGKGRRPKASGTVHSGPIDDSDIPFIY